MNILWVKVGGLWPINIGGRLRSFHIISELARRHKVTLITTHGPADDPVGLSKALDGRARVRSIPFAAPKAGTLRFAMALAQSWRSPLPVDLHKWTVPDVRAAVEDELERDDIDVCIADFLHAIPNVPANAKVPVVLFEHNVESMIWKRLADHEHGRFRHALLSIEAKKMRQAEADACRRSRSVIAVSDADAAMFGANAQSIPTGVDTMYFKANGTPEQPHHLVFSGAMDWFPNEDAIVYFANEVLPAIRREVPDVTMTVVGRNPSMKLKAAVAQSGVRVTGTVPDVRPFIDEGSVYVVPLRIGGGTRLKIFEALSMGKAVVSTTVGAEGLPLEDGRHFVRADSPDNLARSVVSLLRDAPRRRSLGAAGRQLVNEHYSWPSVARVFEERCAAAIGH
jgi:polysaccharide biosynthesis protein PslH